MLIASPTWAAGDTTVTAVTFEPTSTVAGATVDADITFTTMNTISSGVGATFAFLETSGTVDPDQTGFDFSSSTISINIADFDYSAYVGGATAAFTPTANLAPGTYTGTISNIVLTENVGTYTFGITTKSGENATYTESDEFTIAAPYTSPEYFSAFSVSGNEVAGAKTDQQVDFTIGVAAPPSTPFYISWDADHFTDPADSGFDYSNIEVVSEELTLLTCAPDPTNAVLECDLGAEALAIPPGDYSFTVQKVVNPSTVADYTPSIELYGGENLVQGDIYTTHNIGKLKKKKIEVLKKKSKRPQFKAKKRITDTNWNKVKLMKKKGKKYEKVKTFNFKKLKKRPKKKYFKANKKYKIKWKTCYRYNDKVANEICGNWTTKTFKLK